MDEASRRGEKIRIFVNEKYIPELTLKLFKSTRFKRVIIQEERVSRIPAIILIEAVNI